jgi:hypothetical protein
MRIIQSLADIEMVKASSNLPLAYVRVIEEYFTLFFDSAGHEESIIQFRLPVHEAILILESNQDVTSMMQYIMDIEFIDFESVGEIEYYRIGKRNDHEIQLCFALRGSFSQQIEQWLEEQAMKGE